MNCNDVTHSQKQKFIFHFGHSYKMYEVFEVLLEKFCANKDTSDAIENASTIIYLCFAEVDKSELECLCFRYCKLLKRQSFVK